MALSLKDRLRKAVKSKLWRNHGADEQRSGVPWHDPDVSLPTTSERDPPAERTSISPEDPRRDPKEYNHVSASSNHAEGAFASPKNAPPGMAEDGARQASRHPIRNQLLHTQEDVASPTNSSTSAMSPGRMRGTWSETVINIVEEALAVALDRNQEAKFSISPEIDCELIVDLRKSRLRKTLSIAWLQEGQYDRVKETIRTLLSQHVEQTCKSKAKVYQTSAEASLFKVVNGDQDLLASARLQHREHWAERVPVLIGRHGAANPFATLQLQLIWKFDWLTIQSEDPYELADEIQKLIKDKLETNWRGEKFLPKTDLHAIFSDEIIEKLIHMDESLNSNSNGNRDRALLVQRVSEFATRLLAICIYTATPLSWLYDLVWSAGLEDTDLPFTDPIEGFRHFSNWESSQKMFTVYNFDKANLKRAIQQGNYEVISEGEVVPIYEGKSLGEGAFGWVTEVWIHNEHHDFEENVFALKELKTKGIISTASFNKEHHVFSKLLGLEHTAILIPLAMWRHRDPRSDHFYMLYPKARLNLKQYLSKYRTPPTLEKDFVLHLMSQLYNIADALDSIHRLRKSREVFADDVAQSAVESDFLEPPTAERRLKRIAYHHDVKPENILIFDDGSWKISDFGTASVIEAISGRPYLERLMRNREAGDPVYSSPDREQGAATGRPYDIWSLGCVLLEILVTMFEKGTDDQSVGHGNDAAHILDVFEAERAASFDDGIGGVGAYWYKDKQTGLCRLRRPVVERLDRLKGLTRVYDQFDALVGLAGDMLAIDAMMRPSAESVSSRIKTIKIQVEQNLRDHEDFYKEPGRRGIFASRSLTHEGSHIPSATVADYNPSKERQMQSRPPGPFGHAPSVTMNREIADNLPGGLEVDVDDSQATPEIQVTSSEDDPPLSRSNHGHET
ncbi:hypothetical protein LTR10_022684 [Elasticomyces elasticus]|uniref:Protein kinase domain-containing protein n=1 Tax=Exophiala sideris TaxID=1016849 RepID=A0ABR0JLS1_9EURO|nr:hypothetical protein LTR10_022684 [Elasticomyces elasticus]KAK5036556.1 hypothetical protein LTS07_002283 [Exophiala sideris]KAK5041615.1 hypothetical protein LTR13_002282 [Exophiala sideris]KAK5066939.1 hypothetical protein LTR69_002287 [Exophiala sideris]KAK5184998.1 hypothetical protein LTR44_002844 [Eurotiomycetes sp. CCFEE 6388]